MISYLICFAILLTIYAVMFCAKKNFQKSQGQKNYLDMSGAYWDNHYYGGDSYSNGSDCGSDFAGGGDCRGGGD